MKINSQRFTILFLTIAVACTLVALFYPKNIEGNGCIILGYEYRLLIYNNRLAWMNEEQSSIPYDSIKQEMWYRANFKGKYYPIGIYGHLGKFYCKIKIDTLNNAVIDSSCKEELLKLW